MKKQAAWTLGLLMLLVWMGLPAAQSAPEPTVTVLLYMNGSDLESEYGAATFNLEQILAAPESPNVTLLLQTGGTRAWESAYISPRYTQRFARAGDAFTLVESIPRVSVGDPGALADFIAWGTAYAPADRTILLFWNHGLGPIGGFGVDAFFDCGLELYSGDTLTLAEMHIGLSQAYARTGVRFDLIGFDCCLMATLETAQICAPFAQVLVASEESEPQTGWDYGALLQTLCADPGIAPEALGQSIADSYYAQCRRERMHSDVTLSVVRLSEIAAITQALDSLVLQVDAAFADEPDHFYAFARRALRAKAYGGVTDAEGYTDMVDLDDLASRLADQYPQEAAAVRAAVAQAVAYQVTGWQQQHAGGLAVYLPLRDQDYFYESIAAYERTQASEVYKLFVSAFALGLLDPGSVSGDVLSAYQGEGAQAAADAPAAISRPESIGLYAGGHVLSTRSPRATAQPTQAPSAQQGMDQAWTAFLADPTAARQEPFFLSDVWLDEEGYCHVLLNPQLYDRVDLIYFTLATPYDEDHLLLLGQDSNLTVDARSGDVQEWFEGDWFALDGHFVMPEVVEETDETIRYAIPVLVDGQLAALHAIYSWDAAAYELLGYRLGSGAHDMGRLLPLQKGQEFTPLFRLYDVDTGQSDLVEGQSFLLGASPTLTDEEVPDGAYAMLFVVRDVLQNLHYTDYYHWDY